VSRLSDRPGLQAERTIMAWDRTVLGVLANGALLLLRTDLSTGYDQWLPAAGALALGVTSAVLARLRHHQLSCTPPEQMRPAPVLLAAITTSICLLGALVIVFLLRAHD
jgi:putative membrane protein